MLEASGKVRKTLNSCRAPEAGIAFDAGRAFVACSEDGRGGRVTVLDATTFAPIGTISVAPPIGDTYFLTAIARDAAVEAAKLELDIAELKSDVRLLKWMAAATMVLTFALLLRAFSLQ